MAVQFDPIAKDESLNTTELTPRNVADVLAQELANIATAIGGGGGSGGHTIENSSGTALPQRTNLQFTDGLNATDDSGNDATVVSGSALATKTDIATVESGSTASRAYSVGELVYVNGNLYKAITAISLGSTFTIGTNIQATNVSQIVDSLSAVGVGRAIDLHGYTSSTPYVTECDGFAYIAPQVNNEFLWIKGFSAMGGLASQLNTTFVKKGMELYTNASSSSTVRFTEIV